MLQRNPAAPAELPPTAEVLHNREILAQQETDKRFEKYIKNRRRMIAMGKVAIFTGLVASTHAQIYMSDVRENILESADANPSVEILAPAINEENNDKATVFFHGFNTSGAEHLVNTIGQAYQQSNDGQLWSIEYNNAPLDGKRITNQLVKAIEEQDIERLDFVFYSEGGDDGTKAMVDSIRYTDAVVENVTYHHSPSSYDSLTQKTKEEIGIAKDLAWIPFIEYSTPVRLGAEAYFYRDYMQKDPIITSGGIVARYENGNMTNNLFLNSQINNVVESNIPAELEELSELDPTEQMPKNINYIYLKNDHVVDNFQAMEDICHSVQKIGLNCNVTPVESRHGDYFTASSIESYSKAYSYLAEKAISSTAEEIAKVKRDEVKDQH